MIFDKLNEYSASGMYPMHMPGHKRNPAFLPSFLPAQILDITEIPGFDDLSDPKGILLETAKLAAKLYGSREAFLLINGSTVGNIAAIGAHTKRGDKILTDANCHRSIPNAARLFGLEIVSITPEHDKSSNIPYSIKPGDVEAALERNPDIKLAVITSPNYEGVVSDIASIAEIVHNAGAFLHVDCAHGAHLGFSDYFPKSPITLGADTAVVSLHKTLPALTQSSLLHICSERTDAAAVKEMLGILQTSSPSYVLMASIDYCLRTLAANKDRYFREYEENLTYFYNRTRKLTKISVLQHTGCSEQIFARDPGKIVIISQTKQLKGKDIAEILREKYLIEVEKVCEHYVIAMTSICDTYDGFERLTEALFTA